MTVSVLSDMLASVLIALSLTSAGLCLARLKGRSSKQRRSALAWQLIAEPVGHMFRLAVAMVGVGIALLIGFPDAAWPVMAVVAAMLVRDGAVWLNARACHRTPG